MEDFDFIIAGGGAAGLGLAYQMARGPLNDASILVIDKDAKDRNDRTWCFWSERATPFDAVVSHSWDRVAFYGEGFSGVLPLGSYRYNLVHGIDFYRFTRAALEQAPNVRILQAGVEQIEDGPKRAVVHADGQAFRAGWVFDSILRPGEIQVDRTRHHFLSQHFLGWEIETPADAFDPSVPVLFDFRTPQHQEMRFFYILPSSPRRALVEYTLFSADLLTPEEYATALRDYLGEVLGLSDYRVVSEESGVIPMTDRPFPRRLGQRILAVGTKGGRVKPSSGYAFLRMQQDGAAIVRSLARTGTPFDLPRSPARYRFYDSIMLQLMYRQGGKMKGIFTNLFQKNPPERIFHFLDEDQSLLQDARLMATLPTGTFFAAMLKIFLLRKL